MYKIINTITGNVFETDNQLNARRIAIYEVHNSNVQATIIESDNTFKIIKINND